MYLGLKVVIVKSFARIHLANLINFSILPLTFSNLDDYEKIEQGDQLEFPELKKRIETNETVICNNKTKGIEIACNYSLSERLYVKVGLEYYGSRSSSDKQYQVNWNDAVENYDYKFVYKISGFMPYVGIETRFSSFGLYANVGLSFSSFSYTEKLDFSENSYSHKLDNEFNTDGKGIGIILGGKYMMKIGEKIKLLFKLEYMLLKVSTLKGEKLSNGSSTGGESFSESITGTAYENEINPYDLGWINFWELYETSLDESWVRNFKKLSLNLSSIRFIIGISF